MKKNSQKRILSFVLSVLVAAAALTGCNGGNDGKDQSSNTSSQTQTAVTEIGEGNTVFAFEVTDNENNLACWNVHTDETTVGAALLAVGLIKGDDSEYGLMVSEVNGLTADYNTDKAYWAFYVDGEYATAGVDSTEIEPDKTYAFVYTKE